MIEEGCATDTPRKRILIVNNNMHIGGVQKALVNLLKEIASEYEVTLLLFYKGGELLRDVPENVQVITACKALGGWGATREDAAGRGDKVSIAVRDVSTNETWAQYELLVLYSGDGAVMTVKASYGYQRGDGGDEKRFAESLADSIDFSAVAGADAPEDAVLILKGG